MMDGDSNGPRTARTLIQFIYSSDQSECLQRFFMEN